MLTAVYKTPPGSARREGSRLGATSGLVQVHRAGKRLTGPCSPSSLSDPPLMFLNRELEVFSIKCVFHRLEGEEHIRSHPSGNVTGKQGAPPPGPLRIHESPRCGQGEVRCQASCCPGSWDLDGGRCYTDGAPSVKDIAARVGQGPGEHPPSLSSLSQWISAGLPGRSGMGRQRQRQRARSPGPHPGDRAEERRVGVGGQREDQSSFHDEQSQR